MAVHTRTGAVHIGRAGDVHTLISRRPLVAGHALRIDDCAWAEGECALPSTTTVDGRVTVPRRASSPASCAADSVRGREAGQRQRSPMPSPVLHAVAAAALPLPVALQKLLPAPLSLAQRNDRMHCLHTADSSADDRSTQCDGRYYSAMRPRGPFIPHCRRCGTVQSWPRCYTQTAGTVHTASPSPLFSCPPAAVGWAADPARLPQPSRRPRGARGRGPGRGIPLAYPRGPAATEERIE